MRADALGMFYGGPAWQHHRDAANATMVDSDNVLLLRSVGCEDELRAALSERVAVGALPERPAGVFTITICPLRDPSTEAALRAFDRCVHPWWIGVGGELLACWVAETSPNNFPRLPVREGEPVIAWLTRFEDEVAQERHAALLESSGCLRQSEWRDLLAGEPLHLRLSPTARSALRR
jgi:hypothetical protein